MFTAKGRSYRARYLHEYYLSSYQSFVVYSAFFQCSCHHTLPCVCCIKRPNQFLFLRLMLHKFPFSLLLSQGLPHSSLYPFRKSLPPFSMSICRKLVKSSSVLNVQVSGLYRSTVQIKHCTILITQMGIKLEQVGAIHGTTKTQRNLKFS